MNNEYNAILAHAIAMARQAGDVQLKLFRSNELEIATKQNDFDVVTAADKAASADCHTADFPRIYRLQKLRIFNPFAYRAVQSAVQQNGNQEQSPDQYKVSEYTSRWFLVQMIIPPAHRATD